MDGVFRQGRIGVVVLLAFAGLFSHAAQEGAPRGGELDGVIESYRRTLGERARTGALSGFVEIGFQEGQEGAVVRIVHARAPRSVRVELLASEGRIVQGCDGFNTWAFVQQVGGARVRVALAPAAETSLRRAAALACMDPLLNPDKFGYELSLRDELPAAEGHRLVEVSEGGKALSYVRIHRRTGRMLARWNADTPDAIQVVENFREVDGGVWPSELVYWKDGSKVGTWRLADVRFGDPVDVSLFAAPIDEALPRPATKL